VDDPLAAQFPVFIGYCGVHSAEFGPVWTGDLGRSGAAAPTALVSSCPDLWRAQRAAQIGLACAAGRVNVGGLDSWLALVEQPPRTDEAPRPQEIARTFPRGSPGRSRRQGNRAEPERSCAWTCPVVLRRSVLRVSSMALSSSCPSESAPRLRSRPSPSRRRTLTDIAAVKVVSGWSVPKVRASSSVARTGGFVGLRWAGPGGTAKGPCPTEPAEVATRSPESNVPTNTSTPR
jgi:hypothetical protein